MLRWAVGAAVWAFVLGNVAAIVWLWVANHNLDFTFAPNYWAAMWNRLGGLTGLLGAFLALVQVLLLARLPLLGRTIGFDRLTVWHRWNGYLVLVLVVAHTVLAVLGLRAMDRPRLRRVLDDARGGVYPGMVTATIGLPRCSSLVVSSIVIVAPASRYEHWYRCTSRPMPRSPSRGSTRSRPATTSPCPRAPPLLARALPRHAGLLVFRVLTRSGAPSATGCGSRR